MTEEEYKRHKNYAGPVKPSMNRRRIGHDYHGRRMYLITITTEGRRPLLGRLVGEKGDSPETATAHVEPTALGLRVQEEWLAVKAHHPEVSALTFQLMPDHLHGILFVERPMKEHLSDIITGFKTSTNKAFRQLAAGSAAMNAAAQPQHSEPDTPGAASGASAEEAAAPPQHSEPTTEGAAGGASFAVGCAAAVPQPEKRDRSHESRTHGLLWSPNYNDHILDSEGELHRWQAYILDNPRRLFLRRSYPELLHVSFGLRIGRFNCSAVGNRFLLSYPQIVQVQCSTHYYESDIKDAVKGYMAKAHQGAVLVSPSISEGEQRTMRAAFDARLPIILVSDRGFGTFTKPGGAFFDACAEGRLLIISQWEHQNQKVKLTRQMCMEMNELARLIAEGQGAEAAGISPGAAAPPSTE